MKTNKKNINEEQIKKYLNNRMSDQERHKFEKMTQANPFLSEALDGLQMLNSDDLEADLELIKLRIGIRNHKYRFKYWMAAASILVFFVTGTLIIINSRKFIPPVITENKPGKPEQPERTITQEAVSFSEKPEEKEKINSTPVLKKGAVKPDIPKRIDVIIEKPKEPAVQTVLNKTGETQPPISDKGRFNTENITEEVKNSGTSQIAGVSLPEKNIGLNHNDSAFPYAEKKFQKSASGISFINAGGKTKSSSIQAEISLNISGVTGDSDFLPNVVVIYPKFADRFATPVTGFSEYLKYLRLNSYFPDSAGKAIEIVIRIAGTGKINSIKIINVLDTVKINQIRSDILHGPEWTPAISKGEPLESLIKLSYNHK